MIQKLQLQNFKCFQQLKSFEFEKLNLLTGINGRGKSSLLQALLVLSQSIQKNGDIRKLIINSELIDLGNFDDIKNSETPRNENISFSFQIDGYSAQAKFTEDNNNQLQATLVNLTIDRPGCETIFLELFKKIHFVSADRLGPVKYVDKTDLPEFIHVGPRGEHTINILANSINLPIVNDILYRGEDAKSVIRQTAEWLSYILDGGKIDIKGKDKDSSVIYMLLNNKNNAYAYKPMNVGFGYSYILPLIVTGLIAQSGEIIIIENPEAHLHPRAQSRIAEFLAKVASCGIQVFVESHSEHILNGFRISALRPDIAINNKELAIQYFNENFDSERLQMDEKGKIANWPTGFFDQQELDLTDIFKYSRNA